MYTKRVIAFLLVTTLCQLSWAGSSEREFSQIEDVKAYLQKLDSTIALARDGEYGTISKTKLASILKARQEISSLLTDQKKVTDLDKEERVELYNAQELILSAINIDDKSRIVCKRGAATGTRLAKTECMTVAERERRAETAREYTKQYQYSRAEYSTQ